jgi:alpha-tubulin suppressor-like RCC1 family protein
MINLARKYYHVLTIMVLAALIAACGSGNKDHLSSSSDPGVFYSHSVAFTDTATYTWGANTYGQLGNGDNDTANNQYTPVQVVGVNKVGYLTGITGVSAGGTHILAFINNGNVYAWGNNGDGQLGNNSDEASSAPVQVIKASDSTPLSGITAVSAGGSHSLALRNDGTVWAWGSNDEGKLGVTTPDNPQRTAVQVTSLTTAVTKVAAAGGGHSLALMDNIDKTVMSWGRNTSGQLGRSTTTPATPGTVVKVAGDLTNVTGIAAGMSHSLFLLGDGTVWACGYNLFGQLGDGSTTSKNFAVQVVGLTGIATQIAAGFDHTLARMSDGSVWAWGLNNSGQLGNGAPLTGSDLQTSTFPVQVKTNEAGHPYLSGITKIVAIGNHNLAVDGDGHLWVWGYNSYGELGLEEDDATNRNYATRVTSVPVLSDNAHL